MNHISLEKRLRSIGKNIFVNYYEEFKNDNREREKLAEKLLNENEKASSIDAQKTRISNARKIFESNLQEEALQNILNSDKVERSIVEKAKILLASERSKVMLSKLVSLYPLDMGYFYFHERK